MAREFRRITFSNSELKDALAHPRDGFGNKINSSEIVSTAPIRKNHEHFLELELFDFSKAKSGRLEIAETIVQDCLLAYCESRDICLPRDGEKTLRLIESEVCIDIHFNAPVG